MLFQSFFLSLSSLSILSTAISVPRASSDGLKVRTNQGVVQGFINSTAPHVRQWLGIPYAQPPVGDLRFMPPAAPTSHKTGVLQALAFKPSCMQQGSNITTIYTAQVPEFLLTAGSGTSEDCLYLNVFAPEVKINGELVPVVVYLPGGGLTSGGANSLAKIPDLWVERTQAHIAVIINYRVNIFGFPNAEGLDNLNLGLQDQRRAVQWVHNNIKAFGGDPNRLTLWGQSAGGYSSDNYAYAYYKNPIVRGLIADSGSAYTGHSGDVSHSNFTFLASLVGCRQTDAQARLTCMRAVPATIIEGALTNYSISGASPPLGFQAIADEKVVFSNYTERMLSGRVAKVPLMIGSNTNEGAGFVSYTLNGPGASTLLITTLSVIACPVAREVRNRALGGLPTYRYNYAGNFTNISPVAWMGAYHSSELPLVFGTFPRFPGAPITAFEYTVSAFMQDLWLSFIRDATQAPSAAGYTWPLYNSSANTMTLIASNNTLVQQVPGSVIDSLCSSYGLI